MYKFLLVPLASLALFAQEPITPVSENTVYQQAKAELGRKIFFDKTLSTEGKLSCASCHHLPGSGADSKQYSVGDNGKQLGVNTPTILNSAFNGSFFYDGRTSDRKEQVKISLESPQELDTSSDEITNKLTQNPSYKKMFDAIYPDSVTKENLYDAIAEFELALFTPNSKFDVYLRGDTSVLSSKEEKGYKKFISTGCINCHNGVNIGGNMYQKMGVFIPYKQDKNLNGRIDVTKRKRDQFVYKVPTLRNIALTAPYMHDGQVKTLKEAIKSMRVHQFGVTTDSKSIEQIEAFLRTLTGEIPDIIKGEAQ
jgi:cytochrome c peroxidase